MGGVVEEGMSAVLPQVRMSFIRHIDIRLERKVDPVSQVQESSLQPQLENDGAVAMRVGTG